MAIFGLDSLVNIVEIIVQKFYKNSVQFAKTRKMKMMKEITSRLKFSGK